MVPDLQGLQGLFPSQELTPEPLPETWSSGSKYVNVGDIQRIPESRGTPKSSILMGFSNINQAFWGSPIDGPPHVGVLLAPKLDLRPGIAMVCICYSVPLQIQLDGERRLYW